MCLTYDDYQSMGGTAAEAAFPALSYRAQKRIDALTHGRIANESPTREAVLHALTALIDAMAADAEYGGRELTGAGNDGVSVSFASGNGSPEARYNDIVIELLSGETTDSGLPILYAGVS